MSLIALGVTGGISAYKAVEIARLLQQAGHEVVAVMTEAATKFVGPLTFEAITNRRVVTRQFDPGANADIEHISLASAIGVLLVAPATANIIGKFAAGIADDFLSSLYLATRAPVVLAPAMNTVMWEHAAVQQNLQTLASRGVHVVEPGVGFLACGWTGKGRLADPEAVVAATLAALRPPQTLAGRRVLVSAGPTLEDIDPVRYVGNRSSGRMGFALAEEAARRGATVTLVVGPTVLTPPAAADTVRVRSAAEMREAILERARQVDCLIMTAAVADYAPERVPEKIAKDADEWLLRLRRTPDILAEVGRLRAAGTLRVPVLIGFAAETGDPVARARDKRRRKQVDLIVANDVSRADAGFEVDQNAVTLVSADDEREVPLQSKGGIARAILDRAEELLAHAEGAAARP